MTLNLIAGVLNLTALLMLITIDISRWLRILLIAANLVFLALNVLCIAAVIK